MIVRRTVVAVLHRADVRGVSKGKARSSRREWRLCTGVLRGHTRRTAIIGDQDGDLIFGALGRGIWRQRPRRLIKDHRVYQIITG